MVTCFVLIVLLQVYNAGNFSIFWSYFLRGGGGGDGGGITGVRAQRTFPGISYIFFASHVHNIMSDYTLTQVHNKSCHSEFLL